MMNPPPTIDGTLSFTVGKPSGPSIPNTTPFVKIAATPLDSKAVNQTQLDCATPREQQEFEDRVEAWRESYRSELEAGGFAPGSSDREFIYEQLIWQTIQIERARKRQIEAINAESERAAEHWDVDRSLKAEEIGAALARKPNLVVATLRTFFHGAFWLLQRWEMLALVIREAGTVSPEQVLKIYDLSGTPLDERYKLKEGFSYENALTLIDKELVTLNKIYLPRLKRLDEHQRQRVIDGTSAEDSRAQREIKRDHAYAMRLYNQFRKELYQPSIQLAPSSEPDEEPQPLFHALNPYGDSSPKPTPAPAPTPPPTPTAKPASSPSPIDPFDVDDRRALALEEKLYRARPVSSHPTSPKATIGSVSALRNEPTGTMGKMNGTVPPSRR